MPEHTEKHAKNSRTPARPFCAPPSLAELRGTYLSAGIPARGERHSSAFPVSQWLHCAWRTAVPYGSVTAQVLHLFPYYLPFRGAPIVPYLLFYSISCVNSTAFAYKIKLYRDIFFVYNLQSFRVYHQQSGDLCAASFCAMIQKFRKGIENNYFRGIIH